MTINNRPVNHYGYAVTDIEEAARAWSAMVGAGPFLLIEKMQFDCISHFGEDCVFLHSAAFGQWGSIAIELMKIYECTPPSLAQRFLPGAMPVLNHVSYLSPDPEGDSAALDARGVRLFMRAKIGEVDVRLHDATHTIGCSIEIHRKTPFIEGFFAQIERESRGWDGRDPVRLFKPD
jgi:methylmalonyl-CoA/ethylmalonyl-CoA epimerase